MMTLLTTLVSFLAGGLPKILDFFQDRSDKKHEAEMARMQMERDLAMAREGFIAQQRIEEIRTEQVSLQAQSETIQAALAHDTKINDDGRVWGFMVNLRASVRPVVTYIFVLELVLINFATLAWLIGFFGPAPEVNFKEAVDMVFSSDEMQIVSSIVAFWFGTQAFSKK
jgi:hypothetical protein